MSDNIKTLRNIELNLVSGGVNDWDKVIAARNAKIRAVCDECGEVTMVGMVAMPIKTVMARCETCGHMTRMTVKR